MRIIRGIYFISQERKHIAVASQRIVSQILYMFSYVQIGSDWKIHPYYENNKRNISHTSTKKTYINSITENCFTNNVYVFICYRSGVIGRSRIMRIIRGIYRLGVIGRSII